MPSRLPSCLQQKARRDDLLCQLVDIFWCQQERTLIELPKAILLVISTSHHMPFWVWLLCAPMLVVRNVLDLLYQQ